MKAASGDMDRGGDKRLPPAAEGRSLDILCVLDLGGRGEERGGVVIDMADSRTEAIVGNGKGAGRRATEGEPGG